jgi:hypothetical protein
VCVFDPLPPAGGTPVGARHRAPLEGRTRAPARGAPRPGAHATTNHATG